MATPVVSPRLSALDQKLEKSTKGKRLGIGIAALMLVGGVSFIAVRLTKDLELVHSNTVLPFLLLGLALFIALGFEFVNGFHDTANAVATVIYTHSLEPHLAVVWSGIWNFVGVLTSSGTVAFAIVSLLPVQLVLKVSHGSGFTMVFALLVAAILWNLATWLRGLPASSSHTMIGSILGVGVAYQLMRGNSGASGVAWDQVIKVGQALVLSPIVGFTVAAVVFFLFKIIAAKDKRLFEPVEGTDPPPLHIRLLLILTCTGVSFFHGSNDGQKGMGLIMLILVGTVPTAYALNHAVSAPEVKAFTEISTSVTGTLGHYGDASITPPVHPADELEQFISTRKFEPIIIPAIAREVSIIQNESNGFGSLGSVPANMQGNVRNQMYLTSESLRVLAKVGPKMSADDSKVLGNYRKFLDRSTQFIPTWVKVAVALALGLGTMVGWKRIVITVGEKIGKTHLTYAQGAAAELTAMFTIGMADGFGLPVSTTHVLSSGIAGTMVASGGGIQKSTIRNILLAWFFTLPAAALLSGTLFFLFSWLGRMF